jgi:hypothetical protein
MEAWNTSLIIISLAPRATTNRATFWLANCTSNTLSCTRDMTRRSGGAQRKWLTKFCIQTVEKQGDKNGGVTQAHPGREAERPHDGEKETEEWRDQRTMDWNR